MGTKLEVTSTTHILPFNELSPLDFERLCLWLVGREGYVRAEHLGAAGNEQGRDVIAYKPTPDGEELWYFQCKRYRSIGAATLKGEVDKYFQLEQETSQQKPVGVVFVTSCTISARTRKAVGAYCSEHGLAYEFWAKTELDEKVKRYRDIVDAFFRAGQGSKSVVGDGNVIGDHGQSHVAGVRIGNGFSGGTVAAAGHNVVVYTGDWSIPIDFYSNLARQLPQPRYPPIPSGELFAADLTPCFTCFQSASNSYPQKGEEIQVRLRITNESYVEAKDVQINIRLPSGYTRVDTCCDLSHYQAAVGPYDHLSLILILRATTEGANPLLDLTISYRYGEDGKVEGQPLQVAPARASESLWDLVNQRKITARLQSWLEALRPGEPPFVWLDGDLGVGKTQILQHVVRVALQMGYYVFHDVSPRGRSPSRPDPLPPMLERGVCRLAPDAGLDQIVRGIAGCTDYTPMVLVIAKYLGHPVPGTGGYLDLFDQPSRHKWIARFLIEFSRHRRVLIVVDDLDRTPRTTLRLLISIAREAEAHPQPRIRILTALNSKAKAPPALFRNELRANIGDEGRWPVRCLKETDDIQKLLEEVYGYTFPLRWVRKLSEHYQGKPASILEHLQELEKKGKLRLSQGQWNLEVPEERITPDQVLKSRLSDSQEDKNCYRYLQAMTILGRELEYDDIVQFVFPQTELSEDAFEEAEKRLLDLGVLTKTDNGLWAVTPPILYEVVVKSQSASEFRWRRLHLHAANYLISRYKDHEVRAAEIAYHYLEAGKPGDAFDYLLRAAQWEMASKDLWRTIELYELALEHLPEKYPPRDAGQLRLRLADLYQTAGDYERAQIHLGIARSSFERAEDAIGSIQVRIQQGWIAHLQQNYQQALSIYELAQRELDLLLPGTQHSSLQRELWRRHGISAIREGQMDAGRQLVTQALSAARTEADAREIANIYLDIGLCYFKRNMWQEALEQYNLGQKALEHVETVDDFEVKAKLVVSTATVYLRQHEDEQAFAKYQQAIKLAREISYPNVEAEASYGLGILFCESQDWDQAVRHLAHAARTFGRLGKAEATQKAYDELLKVMYKAERWRELLYEASYAKLSNALSQEGSLYVAYALSCLGQHPTEYPDLFS